LPNPDLHLPRDPDNLKDTDDQDVPGLEDFGEEPKPLGPLAYFPSLRHALPALLLFMIFYIATVIYSSYPEGEYLWLSGNALFIRHEYWRLLTSLFTHADLSHLLSNALIFLVFGWMLKAYFGMIAFPVASLLAGIITNLITIAVYEPGIKLLGASGMAYGMVSFWLIFYIRHDTDHAVPIRIFRAIGFSLVMMFPTTFDPQVSYLAHAVGFITGIVLGILLLPIISVHNPK
jgi:rhomboid protease GluP